MIARATVSIRSRVMILAHSSREMRDQQFDEGRGRIAADADQTHEQTAGAARDVREELILFIGELLIVRPELGDDAGRRRRRQEGDAASAPRIPPASRSLIAARGTRWRRCRRRNSG